jgi:uncharacterized protein YndB with AHSA1/START domain
VSESPAAPVAETRDIELSIEIEAPADAVWRAISEGERVANWFAPIASGETGPGGHLKVSWGGDAAWTSWVTAWEPPHRLRLADELPEEATDQGAAMAYEYRIEDRDGTTLLTLVNSGLSTDPSWDETVHMMTNGWRFFIWNLKHYLERHPAVARIMISERPWVTGTRAEVWDAILGADGLGDVPARTGDRFNLRLDGGEILEGTVVLCDRPWAFAGRVTSLNDGILHVEMEGSGDRWKMGVWLSTYGLEKERCKKIGTALAQTMSRLFPGED